MDAIVAESGKQMPVGGAAQGAVASACGRDCSTCAKKLTCPFSPFVSTKGESGRA